MTDKDLHFYEPAKGHVNLAPYSFFNAFCYVPPIIGFSSTNWKDTVSNMEQTGEFVWNLATMDLARQMNATAAHVAPEVDEFEVAGLTAVPGRLVAAPRVKESPVNFECKVSQVLRLRGADGTPAESWLVIGEVVCVYIDPVFIRDGLYQTAEPHPILRAGRLGDYIEVRPDAMFEMPRPGWPIG